MGIMELVMSTPFSPCCQASRGTPALWVFASGKLYCLSSLLDRGASTPHLSGLERCLQVGFGSVVFTFVAVLFYT